MYNGPTDFEYNCGRMDLERIRQWVRRHCFEEAEDSYEQEGEERARDRREAEADLEGLGDEDDRVDSWEPLVYKRGGAAMKDGGESYE